MMVDTGATVIVAHRGNGPTAVHLPVARGLHGDDQHREWRVSAAPVMLTEVRIGIISVRQVQAVVMPGKVLGTNLLGMSFLGRLSRFTVGNDEMVLRQ